MLSQVHVTPSRSIILIDHIDHSFDQPARSIISTNHLNWMCLCKYHCNIMIKLLNHGQDSDEGYDKMVDNIDEEDSMCMMSEQANLNAVMIPNDKNQCVKEQCPNVLVRRMLVHPSKLGLIETNIVRELVNCGNMCETYFVYEHMCANGFNDKLHHHMKDESININC